jgi:hypothetical protein
MSASPGNTNLKKAFQDAIGTTFFRLMMKSLRQSTGKPAYLHGGQTEEIFQQQMDEILIAKLGETSGKSFSDGLFERQFPNHVDTSARPSTEIQTLNARGTHLDTHV